MNTLRGLLTTYCESKGYSAEEDSLEEALRESFSVVWTGEADEHRWRTEYDVVAKINDDGVDRFFKYTTFTAKTEDGDAESCGYYFEGIDNVVEVFPKEVTTTIYQRA